MKPNQIIKKYLEEQHVMQLATTSNGRPWCCTVYFVADKTGNLYWASLPSRRHSREIKADGNVAAAIVARSDKSEKVAGIQVEGAAEELASSPDLKPVAESYANKFGRDAQWVSDMIAGKTLHRMYRLSPARFVLFDEYHFPVGDAQHEVKYL